MARMTPRQRRKLFKAEGRDKEGFRSQLPKLIISNGEREGTLNVQCPRKECGGKYIVSAKKWAEQAEDSYGRSCPYCMKTARLPLKYMTKKAREAFERLISL